MKLRTLGLGAVGAVLMASVTQAAFINVAIEVQNPTTSEWVNSLTVDAAGGTYNYRVTETFFAPGSGAGKTVTSISPAPTDGLNNFKFNISETGANFVDLTTLGALDSAWALSPSSTKNGVGSATGITGIVPVYASGQQNPAATIYTGSFVVPAGVSGSTIIKGAWGAGYTGAGKVNGGTTSFLLSATSELGDSSTLAKTPAIAWQPLTLTAPSSQTTAHMTFSATPDAGVTAVPAALYANQLSTAISPVTGDAQSKGSFSFNLADTTDPVYVMLWLTGPLTDPMFNTDNVIDPSTYTGSDPMIAYAYSVYGGSASGPTRIVKFDNLGAGVNTDAFSWEMPAGTTLTQIAAIPEPASLGLIVLGAFGLLSRRRKA